MAALALWFFNYLKGEIGRGGQVSTQGAMHMTAALAGGKMVVV